MVSLGEKIVRNINLSFRYILTRDLLTVDNNIPLTMYVYGILLQAHAADAEEDNDEIQADDNDDVADDNEAAAAADGEEEEHETDEDEHDN